MSESTSPHINIATRNEKRKEYWTAVSNAILLDADISDGAYRLYSLMVMYAKGADGCKLTQAAIAADMKRTERTVRRLLDELQAAGLVTAQQQGLNQANVYIVEPSRQIGPDKKVRSKPVRTKMAGQAGQKSPFSADKNGLHQKSLKSGENKEKKVSPSAVQDRGPTVTASKGILATADTPFARHYREMQAAKGKGAGR